MIFQIPEVTTNPLERQLQLDNWIFRVGYWILKKGVYHLRRATLGVIPGALVPRPALTGANIILVIL